MARPIKNYCDYFSHDRDMRNHRKIKALRTKFGISGYGIWNMCLEYLTGIDGNEFEFSEVEMELMAGDFGVSVAEISDVLNYCIKLELLFLNNGFINSESLDERLNHVYEKRKSSKSKSKKQLRINGKYASNNSVSNGVSVAEMPQSKVKESKVKETINNSDGWESQKKYFLNAEGWQYKQIAEYQISKKALIEYLNVFLNRIELSEDYKDEKELKRHCANWLRKNISSDKTKALEEKRVLPENYWVD
jgi:hypothetical protein